MAEIQGAATHIPCTSGALPERPWSERIPAAIAKAEAMGEVFIPLRPVKDIATGPRIMITAGEVALAKALWWYVSPDSDTMLHPFQGENTSRCEECGEHRSWHKEVPPALRAFCEKVEGL